MPPSKSPCFCSSGALCASLMHGKYRSLVAVVIPLLLVATLWSSLDPGRFWDATKAGWKSSPVNQFGLVAADREDSNGAGEFLQAQQEQSGPFRYFGYHNEFLSYEDDYMRDNYHKYWSDRLAAHLLLDNRARALGLQEIQGYNPVMEIELFDLHQCAQWPDSGISRNEHPARRARLPDAATAQCALYRHSAF